ncbi:MAG: hypothetical protein ACRC0V_01690 [Fusobacteriaceae bacterium]
MKKDVIKKLREKLLAEARNVVDMKDGKGLKQLRQEVKKDIEGSGCHSYNEKLEWVIERAKHYQLKTGTPYQKIINNWVKGMGYWYMNYFQECNQPLIMGENVKVFEKNKDVVESFKDSGFICPSCEKISTHPAKCIHCEWRANGLFGTFGKGITIIVKEDLSINEIFFPVAYKNKEHNILEKIK